MSIQLPTEAVPAQTLQLRRKCWRVVLLLDPVVGSLCTLALRMLADPGPAFAALQALQRTAEQLRRSGHAGHVRAHEAAREAASLALSVADADERLLDRIVADLTSYQAGRPDGLMSWFHPAEIDASLWAAYVSAVQATHRVSWISRHDAA